MGTASEKNCAEYGCDYSYATKMCVEPIKKLNLPETTQFGDPAIDLSDIGSGLESKPVDISAPKTPAEIQNNSVLIISLIFGVLIVYLLLSASVKKTKEAYKASNIPLKNKVKRKELETRLSELEEVTPAEQTYAKSSYEDETEEIREVKKLERQIKIKKLKKELKDLEAEEE
jgi:hypothetical protein